MSSKTLFITGMFRSGTTLLGRLINAHPRIGVASDPFRPFYNSLRSQVASGIGLDVPPDAPLSDYYFDPEGLRVFQEIQQTDLNHPLEIDALDDLRSRCADHGRPYAPRIAESIERLTGETYAELFQSMVDLTGEECGPEDAEAVAFKEVWTDEFTPLLCRSRADIRCIHIVRDPRAVAASKNSREEKYPWWFLARQWRKLAALSWAYSRLPSLSHKVLNLRFEDLIQKPERTVERICSFLDVEYDGAMADPSTYVDGRGQPWQQNTSYGEGSKKFDTSSVDRWRETLNENEVRFVESLCAPEMSLHGYETETKVRPPKPIASPRVEDSNLADWMQGEIHNDRLTTSVHAAKEHLRYNALGAEDVADEIATGCFLRRDVYKEISSEIAEVKR